MSRRSLYAARTKKVLERNMVALFRRRNHCSNDNHSIDPLTWRLCASCKATRTYHNLCKHAIWVHEWLCKKVTLAHRLHAQLFMINCAPIAVCKMFFFLVYRILMPACPTTTFRYLTISFHETASKMRVNMRFYVKTSNTQSGFSEWSASIQRNHRSSTDNKWLKHG